MQGEESTWIVLLQSSSLVTSVTRGLDREEGQDRWLEGVMREEKWGMSVENRCKKSLKSL